MKKVKGLNLEHDLRVVGSNILCVFMPSVRSKKIYPYYPRITWREKLLDVDTLYLADPFQELDEYQEAGGSWFISPDGVSVLPSIAHVLNSHISRSNYGKVILYGSSMGGYAAIILGSLMDSSIVIAECPQLYLDKHPGSRNITTQFCTSEKQNKIPNAVSTLLDNKSSASFTIVVNAFDHHTSIHVLPLMNLLTSKQDPFKSKINILFYINDNYPRGHSALSMDDAIPLIRSFFVDPNRFVPR